MPGLLTAALLLLLLAPPLLAAGAGADASAAPGAEFGRAAIGLNNLGAQFRLHLSPAWAGEARLVTGSAPSSQGTVKAFVAGLRAYRFSTPRGRCRLYAGLEGDYVSSSVQGSSSSNFNTAAPITGVQGFGNTSGLAAGGFGGVEFRPLRRVAFDLDIGPYFIGVKEKVSGASSSSWDFIVNTAVNVYLF